MTNEEIERAMQFILEQQAQINVTMGRLSERVDSIGVKLDRTADGISALLAIAEMHDREIAALSQSVQRVDERQREAVEKLNERQAATDERLHALIDIVERYVGGRREERE